MGFKRMALQGLILLFAVMLCQACDNDGLSEECALVVFGAGLDLNWQNPPASEPMSWSKAKQYCKDLTLNGHSDWRLPDIGELRSLIRGCPGTVTCGACGVTDGCLDSSCNDGGSCDSCSHNSGPADGCYWPDSMKGNCSSYWSSSAVADTVSLAWYVYFGYGDVYNGYVNFDIHVRCVR